MRARELIEGPMPAAPPITKPPATKPIHPPPVRRTVPNRPDPFRRQHPGTRPNVRPKAIADMAPDSREMALGGTGGMHETKGQQLARHLLDEA